MTILCLYASGQQNQDVQLPPFEILDSLSAERKMQMSYSFDSLQTSSNAGSDVGDFLRNNTSIFIKDYGPGSNSSMSYRGGSSYHTRIYWDGISIDNAMLGQSDLSLYHLNDLQEVAFVKSGNSLALGNGGFGGILNFGAADNLDKSGLKLTQYIGSFGQYGGDYNIHVVKESLFFDIFLSYDEAENNFKYNDEIAQQEDVERQNAAYSKWQIMPRVAWKIDKYQKVSLTYWMNSAEREIPSAIGTPHNGAVQEDESQKMLLSYSLDRHRTSFELKTAIMQDRMYYENAPLNIYSPNEIRSIKNLANLERKLSQKWSLEGQLKYDLYEVRSINYEDSITVANYGAFGALNYNSKLFFTHLMLRYENWERQDDAVMPSLNIGWQPFESAPLRFYLNEAWNVRYPTFNDLYWRDASNDELQREEALTSELGTEIEFVESDALQGLLDVAFFYHEINNMIVWRPGLDGVWRPENINQALNRGMELSISFNQEAGEFKWSLTGQYAYTRSQVRNSEEDWSETQQVYVPEHQLNIFLHLHFKGYYVNLNEVFTGYVYTDQSNSRYIDPSYPLNISFGKSMEFWQSKWDLRLDVNNISDQDYQYVQYMPMPGRNYRIKLTYQL